ncbi:MAG: hypothetical protein WBA41_19050 [Rivularia sp. (in: cyanobacteria)]
MSNKKLSMPRSREEKGDGEMGGWGDGGMGRWGDGEMGGWGDEERVRSYYTFNL